MKILSAIGGLFSGFFRSTSPAGVAGAVGQVAGLVDSMVYTDQEKAADDTQATQAALAGQYYQGDSRAPFDVVVDAVNRLQRPSWGVYLFGGLLHWWQLADVAQIDVFWRAVLVIYLTALFGGRAVFVDLMRGLAKLKGRV